MSSSILKMSALLLLVVLAGCRTYGGRNSEALTFEQIEIAVQDYARAYDRAVSNAASLEQEADRDPAMETLAAQYAALVALHGARLEQQRDQMEDLRGSGNYRALSRALGGFVKEQQVMAKKYQGVMARYRPGAGDTTAVAFEVPPRSRYQVVPPFYEARRRTSQPRLPGMTYEEGAGGLADTSTVNPVSSASLADTTQADITGE